MKSEMTAVLGVALIVLPLLLGAIAITALAAVGG